LRAKMSLMPERAERVARQASRKVQRVSDDWIRGVFRELRKLVRKLRDRGYTPVIVAVVLRGGSLRGAKLQRTLLKVAERHENLALYDGARRFQPSDNVSGKQCPVCGAWG